MNTKLRKPCLKFLCMSFIIFWTATFVKAQPVLTYTPVLKNMSKPIDIKNAADGSGRMFIVEQTGKIRIYKNGELLPKPFLDITNMVEQGTYKGIINIAFAPNYKINRTFFVYYLDTLNRSTIARFTASKQNPDSAVVSSRRILYQFSPVDTGDTKISIGSMGFGRDRLLYISLSDGSYIGKVTNLAQNGGLPYGKILRVDVNKLDSPYYKIPPSNPYANNPDIRHDIWAIGIRNMWRWSFDRLTGDMWLADDGNSNRDEVNFVTPAEAKGGINFGWKCYEGDQVYDTTGCLPSTNYKFPALSLIHDSIVGCYAIIGGHVYRGTQFPALYGYYVCSDYVTANSWLMNPNGSGGWNVYRQPGVPPGIENYGENESGELFATSLDGTVYQVGGIAGTSIVSSSINEVTIPATAATQLKSRVYPTLVNNRMIVLELNEPFGSFRLFDMNGNPVLKKDIKGLKGNVPVDLPATLLPGMYVVELSGQHSLKQKIFISR